jgi:hypothetical protein
MTPFLDSPIFEPPSLHLPILGSLIIHAPLVDGFKGKSSSRSKSRAYFGLSQAQKTPWEYPGKTAHHHEYAHLGCEPIIVSCSPLERVLALPCIFLYAKIATRIYWLLLNQAGISQLLLSKRLLGPGTWD